MKETPLNTFPHEVLSRNGKKLFAVIPYEDFVALQQKLEDAEDLMELRKAREESKGDPLVSMEEARKILDCPRPKPSRAKSKK